MGGKFEGRDDGDPAIDDPTRLTISAVNCRMPNLLRSICKVSEWEVSSDVQRCEAVELN